MIFGAKIRIARGMLYFLHSKHVGKHNGPVWEIQWIESDTDNDEMSHNETAVLNSVSTDGRVIRWTLKKVIESQDLIVLKSVPKPQNSGKSAAETSSSQSDSVVARQTGGLCLDFSSAERTTYLVGTENGQIHKCSTSSCEQYVCTYAAHEGAINRVRWSPFSADLFVSCSNDWTARLWHQKHETEIFKFQSGRDCVTGIDWSPHSSTCFATVYTDGKPLFHLGRLEVWDLLTSPLDPVISHSVLDRQISFVSFARKSPCIVTGDNSGTATMYKLCMSGPQKGDDPVGVFSKYASMSKSDAETIRWRRDQELLLMSVLPSKYTH